MLNVKNLTLLSQKNWKNAGILTTVAKKSRALLDSFLQLSVAFWLNFDQNLVLYGMKVIIGR